MYKVFGEMLFCKIKHARMNAFAVQMAHEFCMKSTKSYIFKVKNYSFKKNNRFIVQNKSNQISHDRDITRKKR